MPIVGREYSTVAVASNIWPLFIIFIVARVPGARCFVVSR
jgi:hypothetical protein